MLRVVIMSNFEANIYQLSDDNAPNKGQTIFSILEFFIVWQSSSRERQKQSSI
jgi:hypothetical protein